MIDAQDRSDALRFLEATSVDVAELEDDPTEWKTARLDAVRAGRCGAHHICAKSFARTLELDGIPTAPPGHPDHIARPS